MNVYRGRHQVSPLKHNSELTSVAQSWADRLAASGSLSHNPNASYRGERLGENCAMRWTSDSQGCTGKLLVYGVSKTPPPRHFSCNLIKHYPVSLIPSIGQPTDFFTSRVDSVSALPDKTENTDCISSFKCRNIALQKTHRPDLIGKYPSVAELPKSDAINISISI